MVVLKILKLYVFFGGYLKANGQVTIDKLDRDFASTVADIAQGNFELRVY